MNTVFLSLWWLIPLATVLGFATLSALLRQNSIRAALVSFGGIPIALLLLFGVGISVDYGLYDFQWITRASVIIFLWIGPFYVLSAAFSFAVGLAQDPAGPAKRSPSVLGPLVAFHIAGAIWTYAATRAS